jgi:integrase
VQVKHEAKRKAHRLDDLDIRKRAHVQKAIAAGHDILLADGNGLYLRVRPTGTKTWIVRRKRHGRVQVITLGAYPEIGLKAARQKASDLAAKPGMAGAIGVTVARAIEEFMSELIRPRYRRTNTAEVYARRIKKELGSRALATLQPVEITAMVRAGAKKHPVAANRLLSFTKHFLGWAVEVGYLTTSPAANITKRIAGGEEKSRDRTLATDEIRQFWNATDFRHVRLARFLLLSGLRISEAQRSTVGQIRDNRLHIPEGLSKNGKAHWVHLPELARQQIDGKKPHEFLFRSVSPTAVQAALRRWCAKHSVVPWTPHDLRRTFASGLGSLGIAPHVIATALNHTLAGSSSLAVYLRSDFAQERVVAAEIWAARVAAIVGGSE